MPDESPVGNVREMAIHRQACDSTSQRSATFFYFCAERGKWASLPESSRDKTRLLAEFFQQTQATISFRELFPEISVAWLSSRKIVGERSRPTILPDDRSLLLSGFDAREKKRRQRKRNLVHSSVGGQRFPVFSVPGQPRECSRQQAVDQANRQMNPGR